jgi:hypothetical protein
VYYFKLWPHVLLNLSGPAVKRLRPAANHVVHAVPKLEVNGAVPQLTNNMSSSPGV